MNRLSCVLVRLFLPRVPLLIVLAFTYTSWAFPWPSSMKNIHNIQDRSAENQANDDNDEHGIMPNCTREKGDFPRIFGQDQLGNGAILLHIFGVLYISGCIGYVCQVYFVPSLEIICKEWRLPQDIAGATIMAAGTSLPELFASVMGTFVTEDDTGTGAIVGSAAFNIYAILALCSFLAPKEGVKISWFPVLRDGFYWTVCMIVLIAVVIDGKLLWWESLILSLLYVAYVIVMVFNTPISECIQGFLQKHFQFINFDDLSEEDSVELTPTPPPINDGGTYDDELNSNHKGDDEAKETHKIRKEKKKGERDAIYNDVPVQYGTSDDQAEYIEEALNQKENNYDPNSSFHGYEFDDDDDDSWCSVFHPPEHWTMLILWIVGLPFIALCCISIPDCRKPGIRRKLYILTFIMSATVCALVCYLLFWVVTVIGNFFGIPDIVMGYTLLAIGTSLPDAVASAIVSKHGYHDMAIANISGSNTFEIVIGLGVSWLTKSLLIEGGAPVYLDTHGFAITSSVLLACFLSTILLLSCTGWVLNRKIGVISVVFYVGFLAIAIWLCLFFGVSPYCTKSNE
ncbi:sodium/potassium/calcium exchanger 5-like isoform X2 [Amphiura filiformis]|uniref:sodium/potassium/calcium exchanger 5-like isoform X2 n=1 Tax=Amphiura filiformis TaxID=82378 RepID=UPI003B220C2E